MSESDNEIKASFNDRRIKSRAVRGFYETWDGLRSGRPAPARSDFVPEIFAQWWPDMFLVDIAVEGATPVFTYRLAGGGLEDRLGRALGGRPRHRTLQVMKPSGGSDRVSRPTRSASRPWRRFITTFA